MMNNKYEKNIPLGWYKEGDKVCYNAGDCVITANGQEPPVNADLAEKYHLDIFGDDSVEDTINAVFKIMDINTEYFTILFCAGMMGVLRQLIIDAGIKPTGAIYVVGKSGNGKTTATTLCTKLYNRNNLFNDSTAGIARVNSSSTAIEAMAEECKDCVFILDDLFRTSDCREKKEAERNVRNILRNFADNSPRKTMNSERAVNSQLIITAEYIIDNISDIGRCLILNIKKPLQNTRLSEAQEEPLALSTFYYFFIQYICSHYDETVDFIKKEFHEFRSKAHTHKYHYERVYETAFLLECMFKITCRYAIDKNIFTEEKFISMLNEIRSVLKSMIDFHNEVISIKNAKSSEFNLARALIFLIKNNIIPRGEKGTNCFEKNGDLYIKNCEIIKGLETEFLLKVSAKKISSYFAELGISKVYTSPKNSRKVKKYNNKSYLVLNKDALFKEAFREPNPLIEVL